jgi:hypothetical protein
MRTPTARSTPWAKLFNDVEAINRVLRARKGDLPEGSPGTPFTRDDSPLLEVLRDSLLRLFRGEIEMTGHLDLKAANGGFERMMQQRVLFEKLGIQPVIQVMTIHKAKGREFDGVVLLLENSRKALWRKSSRSRDADVEDLYRVAISRARYAVSLVAFEDAVGDAKEPVRRLLGS